MNHRQHGSSYDTYNTWNALGDQNLLHLIMLGVHCQCKPSAEMINNMATQVFLSECWEESVSLSMLIAQYLEKKNEGISYK